MLFSPFSKGLKALSLDLYFGPPIFIFILISVFMLILPAGKSWRGPAAKMFMLPT